MGFSFRKKIGPGLTLSASRRGLGLSQRVGVPGAGVSVNSRGRVTGTVGAGGVRYQTSRRVGRGGSGGASGGGTFSTILLLMLIASAVIYAAVDMITMAAAGDAFAWLKIVGFVGALAYAWWDQRRWNRARSAAAAHELLHAA
jgi:membrane associated rhomboid family serine protease